MEHVNTTGRTRLFYAWCNQKCPGVVVYYLENLMKNYVQLCEQTEAPISGEVAQRMIQYGRPMHSCMGVQTEGGELANKFKRIIFYGDKPDFTNTKEEIGDILWYLGILCGFLGITMDDCMEANIAKLAERYKKKGKFNEAEALLRNLGAEREVLERTGSALAEVPSKEVIDGLPSRDNKDRDDLVMGNKADAKIMEANARRAELEHKYGGKDKLIDHLLSQNPHCYDGVKSDPDFVPPGVQRAGSAHFVPREEPHQPGGVSTFGYHPGGALPSRDNPLE